MSYCTHIQNLTGERQALHKNYHDHFYGFPIHTDNELFCRLVLEINQAGLSWETILRKEQAFRKAYSNFEIRKVAAYTEKDIERLLNDAGIIRNRLKINAAIENAKTILQLQKTVGSFENWLESHHPKAKQEWVKLFKKTFRFTGGEIVNEFLMSIGYLPGAHAENCPVHKKILKQKPLWANSKATSQADEMQAFVKKWLAASNAFDTRNYLDMYHPDAVLNDPSVGRAFKGHKGIRQYFEDYFIGYKTKTKLVQLVLQKNNSVHLELQFTGTFPGGKIGGTFDLQFREGKIAAAKAELI